MKRIPGSLLIFALIIFLSTLFFSCGKKDAVVNNNAETPTAPDSVYLSKSYEIYSSSNFGDTAIAIYNYDDAKRIINVTYSYAFVPPTPVFPASRTIIYYYNGNDTLPYKLYNYGLFSFISDTTTQFFYYDASGRVIKDSSIQISDDGPNYNLHHIVNTYQYTTGTIYGYSSNTAILPLFIPTPDIVIDTATLDANNYITSNIKHKSNGDIVRTEITNTATRNIYERMSNKSTFPIFPGGNAGYGSPAFNNNPSHIADTWSGTQNGIYVNDMTYLFKSSGMVMQMSGYNPYAPGDIYKGIFYYKSL